MIIGRPHIHFRSIGSTNERARQAAGEGAPAGTLVTAEGQTAGRGRQGRPWITRPGSAVAWSATPSCIRISTWMDGGEPPSGTPLSGGASTTGDTRAARASTALKVLVTRW